MPAVYHTAVSKRSWWGLEDGRTADCGAKPDRSHNSGQYPVEFRVITKHFECAHSMKLKGCSVLDCYNKVSKLCSPGNAKDCSADAAARFVSATSSPSGSKWCSFLVYLGEFIDT